MILSILRDAGIVAFDEMPDRVSAQIQSGHDMAPPDHRTLQRRVYDVLNVFCAIGIVVKENKRLIFRPQGGTVAPRTPDDPMQQIKERIAIKEAMMIEKGRLVISYRLLIEENRTRKRPSSAVQFPTLFAGIRSIDHGEVKRSLDGTRLEIITTEPPKFFSPMNVLDGLRFTIESQVDCLRQLPQLAGLEPLLFPSGAPEKSVNMVSS
jgi:hypothetical protein